MTSFWKGFLTCSAVAVAILCLSYCNSFRSQLKRTTPTESDLRKIAALLGGESGQQEFNIGRYEFQYQGLWMDKFGASGIEIMRTSTSPSWDEMLKHWDRLDAFPSDFNRLRMHDWVHERLDPRRPFYIRWVSACYSKIDSGTMTVESEKFPQLCAAFFDKDNPDVLYVSTEGELLFPHCTLAPGETTGTLDWSRYAWDGF